MPTVSTAYKSRFDVAEEIARARGATLSCPVELDGAVVEADSGTFTLYDGAGTARVAGSVTTSAAHTATYAIASSAIADLPYGFTYYVEWVLVLGGETHVFRNTCGIVRETLPCPVSQRDLLDLHGELTSYIQGTGEDDLDRWIETAWRYCQRWMQRQGRRASAVLSPADLKELGTVWSLEVLTRDLSTGLAESHFGELAEHYRAERKRLQGEINWEVDRDGDGQIDAKREAGLSTVFLGTHGMLHPHMPVRRR